MKHKHLESYLNRTQDCTSPPYEPVFLEACCNGAWYACLAWAWVLFSKTHCLGDYDTFDP